MSGHGCGVHRRLMEVQLVQHRCCIRRPRPIVVQSRFSARTIRQDQNNAFGNIKSGRRCTYQGCWLHDCWWIFLWQRWGKINPLEFLHLQNKISRQVCFFGNSRTLDFAFETMIKPEKGWSLYRSPRWGKKFVEILTSSFCVCKEWILGGVRVLIMRIKGAICVIISNLSARV